MDVTLVASALSLGADETQALLGLDAGKHVLMAATAYVQSAQTQVAGLKAALAEKTLDGVAHGCWLFFPFFFFSFLSFFFPR
jgi:hypothetical protein